MAFPVTSQNIATFLQVAFAPTLSRREWESTTYNALSEHGLQPHLELHHLD
jgi:hypothetical protein